MASDAVRPIVRATSFRGGVHDGHGAGLVQFAVGRESPATPMQSSPLAMAPATSWARSPTMTACRWQVARAAAMISVFAQAGPPVRGGLVVRGTADAVEEPVDAVVPQHGPGQAFRLLRGHGHGPPGGGEALQDFPDARVQAALRDSGGKVVRAVEADDVVQLVRRNPGDVQRGSR